MNHDDAQAIIARLQRGGCFQQHAGRVLGLAVQSTNERGTIMRKITQDAGIAFARGETFLRGNTSVKVDGTSTRMYLFGNLIAERSAHEPERLMVTLAGWDTAVTRERMDGVFRELGIDGFYYQAKKKQHFSINGDDQEVSKHDKLYLHVYHARLIRRVSP